VGKLKPDAKQRLALKAGFGCFAQVSLLAHGKGGCRQSEKISPILENFSATPAKIALSAAWHER